MTWSRFAAGAAEVVTAETLCCGESRALSRPVGLAHAVPASGGTATAHAVCGERVTVVGGLDWQLVWGVPRCGRCRQLAGCWARDPDRPGRPAAERAAVKSLMTYRAVDAFLPLARANIAGHRARLQEF